MKWFVPVKQSDWSKVCSSRVVIEHFITLWSVRLWLVPSDRPHHVVPDLLLCYCFSNHFSASLYQQVLDVYAAVACVEQLEPPALDSNTQCQDWLKQVKRLQGSIELVCSQGSLRQYGERSQEMFNYIRWEKWPFERLERTKHYTFYFILQF